MNTERISAKNIFGEISPCDHANGGHPWLCEACQGFPCLPAGRCGEG